MCVCWGGQGGKEFQETEVICKMRSADADFLDELVCSLHKRLAILCHILYGTSSKEMF